MNNCNNTPTTASLVYILISATGIACQIIRQREKKKQINLNIGNFGLDEIYYGTLPVFFKFAKGKFEMFDLKFYKLDSGLSIREGGIKYAPNTMKRYKPIKTSNVANNSNSFKNPLTSVVVIPCMPRLDVIKIQKFEKNVHKCKNNVTKTNIEEEHKNSQVYKSNDTTRANIQKNGTLLINSIRNFSQPLIKVNHRHASASVTQAFEKAYASGVRSAIVKVKQIINSRKG